MLHIKKPIRIIAICILIFICWFVWALYTDEPPHFFPLNNPKGEYLITKNCPGGQGWDKKQVGESNAYCVEYAGPDVFMNEKEGNSGFFRITVGKSNIDLEPFLNKKVKNIEGKYTQSSKQCIQGKCTHIYGPLVVLNIDKLEMHK